MTTPGPNDLTTLATLRAWLPNAPAGDATDDLLQRIITAYSGYVQQYMNRTIASTQYLDRNAGTGSDTMALSNYPCTAITSVTLVGQSVPASPDGAQFGYVFDDRFVYLIGREFPRYPPLGCQIAYTAGYSTTPPELEQAVIELIQLRYNERTWAGYSSKSLAGETISFVTKDMPDSVKTILNNYRKVVPV